MTIKKQMFLVIVIFVFLSVMLLGLFVYAFFTDKMTDVFLNEFDNNVRQYVDETDKIMTRVQNFNDYISIDEQMIHYITSPKADIVAEVSAVNQLKKEYERFFNMYFADASAYLSSVFFIQPEMPVAQILIEDNKLLMPPYSVSVNKCSDKTEKLLPLLRERDEIVAVTDPNNRGRIFVAQKIFDNVSINNSLLGINVTAIDFDKLVENRLKPSETMSVAVLNDDEIIYNSGEISDELISEYIENDNNIHIGNFYTVGRYKAKIGLSFLCFVNVSHIKSQINGLLIYILIFTVLILAALITVASAMANHLSIPIVNLTKIMMDFNEDSDAVPEIKAKSPVEVRNLYECFRFMVKRIKELIKQSEESGEKKKEMELRMLNAQINPHFLYNALDSISWMAIDKGNDDIAEMIDILSDEFRYSIKQNDELISIREAMEFIVGYLHLQEKRYRDKVIFRTNIDKSTERLMIPKLIIQPLVENCVIHAMRENEKNIISINFGVSDEILTIDVSDNGTGCDVDKLNRYLDGGSSVLPREKIGIKNVNTRIKMKFGEKYNLRYYKNEKEGITARLTLPVIQETAEAEKGLL